MPKTFHKPTMHEHKSRFSFYKPVPYVFPHIRHRLLDHIFFHQRQRNVFLKTSHLHAYKAPAPASPFFLLKATKCPLKNARSWWARSRFLWMASQMRYFIKNWACDHFVENTAQSTMAPKLMISLQTKAACYSPLFLKGLTVICETKRNETVICEVDQRSNQNTGKMYKSYKNFWKDFVVEQNLTRPKGDFWSYLNRPHEIGLGWPDEWEDGSLKNCIVWKQEVCKNWQPTAHPNPQASSKWFNWLHWDYK